MSKKFQDAYEIYAQCVRRENYDQGIQKLSELIMLKGVETERVLQLRSHLHYLAGNNVQAKQDLDKAIQLDPKSSSLYYDRGVLLHYDQDYYLALRDFCEAVHLAQIMGDDGLIDAAEHHFIEILEKRRRE